MKKNVYNGKILLQEQKKLFKLLIEENIDMIAVLDSHNRYLYVSPSHERILGYRSKDLIGRDAYSLIHPTDLFKLHQEEERVLQGKFATKKEFRIKHKQKYWVTVEGAIQALLDEMGKPTIKVAKTRDITEQKQFEANMKFLARTSDILSSSLEYKTTLESITKLVAEEVAEWGVIDLLTDEGKIEMVSIWHKDPKKREIGVRFRTEFPRDISAPVGVGKAILTGKPQIMIYERDKKTIAQYAGNKTYIKLLDQMDITTQLSVPLRVHDRVIGAITLASTKPHKQFTPHDIEFADELAHRAAMAIENAKLYQEAQQVIASKNDFIAMVTHELKTPVTSVKIHAQILQKKLTRTNTAAYEQFTKMEEQLNKLTGLIDELLDLSRVQQKKLVYHKESFVLFDVVKEITQTMRQTTDAHTISLKGKSQQEVHGDKNRIGQVLTNLISNAIKYSQDETDIIVRIHEELGGIVVSVRDFGIGISKEHQRKVFERFYQVSDTVGRTFPGLGIGLYLSAEIIREHQGTIWVESELGKGSTFSFRLPAASAS